LHIEKELADLQQKNKRKSIITLEHVNIIEDACKKNWHYGKWWPITNKPLPIELPKNPSADKKETIKIMYDHFKHIEVVSVILRFMYPKDFGIISPPVTSILNLVPDKNESNQKYYMRYLSSLSELSNHYCAKNPELKKLSKVDMGLWAAAHLSMNNNYSLFNDEMLEDKYFQKIRLGNLVRGFRNYWEQQDEQRLILAEVLIEHDFILAATIAARIFESIILKFADKSGLMQNNNPKDNCNFCLSCNITKIRQNDELLNKLGINEPSSLVKLHKHRNDIVHPETELIKKCNNYESRDWEEINEQRAKEFIEEVRHLFDAYKKQIKEEKL
jgi:hypothetical protein